MKINFKLIEHEISLSTIVTTVGILSIKNLMSFVTTGVKLSYITTDVIKLFQLVMDTITTVAS